METKKRLIDANALKDRFKLRIDWLEKDKHDEYTTGIWDGCLYDAKLIDEAPTVDAVEVVRCKDCKHRGSNLCPMETVELYPWFGTKNDAFCSYGERREGE